MIKSERMSYNENIAKKFKDDYSGIYNENKLEKGKFEVNIKIKAWERRILWYCVFE